MALDIKTFLDSVTVRFMDSIVANEDEVDEACRANTQTNYGRYESGLNRQQYY